jgi:hypothetical protein
VRPSLDELKGHPWLKDYLSENPGIETREFASPLLDTTPNEISEKHTYTPEPKMEFCGANLADVASKLKDIKDMSYDELKTHLPSTKSPFAGLKE